MPKNFLGREDTSFDGMDVTYAGIPSIEDTVHNLTGYRLPLVDLSRGPGSLVANAAVLGERLMKHRAKLKADAPPNELPAEAGQDPKQLERIRQLMADSASRRSYYNAQMAAQGKSFYPSAQ